MSIINTLSNYLNQIKAFLYAPSSVTGCASQDAESKKEEGVHYEVSGEAREDWRLAAKQILQGDLCKVSEPTAEQINTTANSLQMANETHVKNDVAGVILLNSSRPVNVDHRGKLDIFFSATAEVFVPTAWLAENCSLAAKPAAKPVPEIPKPVVKEQPQEVSPQPEIPAPKEIPEGKEPPPSQLLELEKKANREMRIAQSLINDLRSTGNNKMKGQANKVNNKKTAVKTALDKANEKELKTAIKELKSARISAKKALDKFLSNL
jgi:hypothetical protein